MSNFQNILVTGSEGFIGKNICSWLKESNFNVIRFDINTTDSLLSLVKKSDFVIHLAGINRPLKSEEFYDGNSNLTYSLIEAIKECGRKIPVFFASSIQAALENDYGKSKRMAENFLFDFQVSYQNPVYVYRLQNVFGKWCRPNYNSVIATFCYNVSHDIPLSINDPSAKRDFVYIDDICKEILNLLSSEKTAGSSQILTVLPSYNYSIGEVANIISHFKKTRETLMLPNTGEEFVAKLYATYLSYSEPHKGFSYKLSPHYDNRGSFTEFFKTKSYGQLSINISKPGITKGNHYHHTKNEKFLVVHGKCLIRFRKVGEDKIFEYLVDGNDFLVVDIPCGYIHSITNVGSDDSVTLMWAFELYDPSRPDTFYEEI